MTKMRHLGELITTKKGYAFKSAWFSEHGIPVVKATNFTDDSIDVTSLQFIEKNIATQHNECKLNTDDVVIQTVGSWPSNPASAVGKCIRVPEEANGALLNQNTVILKCHDELDHNFLYYSLRDKRFKTFIENRARGSASQASITLADIKEFEVFQYELEQQKQIGEVLRCYDDLIENNKRRIALLEDSARQLYKEWFVRFRFPGHEHVKIVDGIPEGWEAHKVGDIIKKVKRPGKIKKDDYTESGAFPCVDQSKSYIGGFTDNTDAIIKDPLPLVVFGDHTRVLKFIDFPFACGADGTQLLYPSDERISVQYFYFALLEIDLSNYFYARHFKFLKDQIVLIPHSHLADSFTDFASSNLKQISKLRSLNRQLEKARDHLLPKVMSGELAV